MTDPLIPGFATAQITAALAVAEAIRAATLAANPSATSASVTATATSAVLTALSAEVSVVREQQAAYLAEALRLRTENAALLVKLAETPPVWTPSEAYPPDAG